jgi:hypothetical protein
VPLVLASDLEFLFGFFTCSVSPLCVLFFCCLPEFGFALLSNFSHCRVLLVLIRFVFGVWLLCAPPVLAIGLFSLIWFCAGRSVSFPTLSSSWLILLARSCSSPASLVSVSSAEPARRFLHFAHPSGPRRIHLIGYLGTLRARAALAWFLVLSSSPPPFVCLVDSSGNLAAAPEFVFSLPGVLCSPDPCCSHIFASAFCFWPAAHFFGLV